MQTQPGSTAADVVADRFRRRLRQVREGLGLTQEALAERVTGLGATMHQTTIAKIERGDRGVSIGEAELLALALDLPLARMTMPSLGDLSDEELFDELGRVVDERDELQKLIAPLQERVRDLEDTRKELQALLSRKRLIEGRRERLQHEIERRGGMNLEAKAATTDSGKKGEKR